jgi:hypothetical protein
MNRPLLENLLAVVVAATQAILEVIKILNKKGKAPS